MLGHVLDLEKIHTAEICIKVVALKIMVFIQTNFLRWSSCVVMFTTSFEVTSNIHTVDGL